MDIDFFEHKLQIATADDVNTNGSFGYAVDVDGDVTIRFQVIAINLKRLTCQQMDRHRAAGESIQHNHVV